MDGIINDQTGESVDAIPLAKVSASAYATTSFSLVLQEGWEPQLGRQSSLLAKMHLRASLKRVRQL